MTSSYIIPVLFALFSSYFLPSECLVDKSIPLNKADYYDMGTEEQFNRGICVKLRQQKEFPSQLQFSKPLKDTCVCNKVPVHCLQPYECDDMDISDKKVAFIFSHDLNNVQNYTEALPVEQAAQLKTLHPGYDVIFIVPDDKVILQETLDVAKLASIKILRMPDLQVSESISYYCKYHQEIKLNCCGEREFLKLYAFSLFEYDAVIFLDHDIHLVRPVSKLVNCMGTFDFLSTRGKSARVNGGIFVARPDPKIWEAWVEFLKTSTYSPQDSWNQSEKKRQARYGEESVQGALYAFYYMFDRNALQIFDKMGMDPPLAAQIDRCMYNFIFRNQDTCYRIVPAIVHKNRDRLVKVRWMEDKTEDVELA